MNHYSRILLRFAALFAVIGVFLGAHMAGAGSYEYKPIHTHILLVGWLSLFAFAVFYKIFYKSVSLMAHLQVASAILGSFGLTIGMLFQFINPFDLPETFTLIFYIVGGTILLISFILFFIMTLFYRDEEY